MIVIENNNLVISVSDDGCGFKNIEIEKATLPFYKSSKDISTEHLGLGSHREAYCRQNI